MTHHTQAELLPCPFCGSRARRAKEGDWHGTGCAGAHGCPAYLSALTYRTQEEADEAWNRRAPEPQAQRVPLTDAQIHDWWRSENSLEDCDMCRFADFAQVVRAFELKYGITQEKQG